MRTETRAIDVNEQYAAAHLAHHGQKDLREAVELYTAIIAAHPETQEARQARAQVQSIVNYVVPAKDLFDAHVALLWAYFARTSDADTIPDLPRNLTHIGF